MNLQGQRVTVMGLGRFGGGVGVSRFLVSQGARVLVTDLLSEAKLTHSIAQLADCPIEFRLGEHREQDFTNTDLIVVNPAVDPRQNPYLQAAAAARIPTTTEIRLLVEHLPNRARTIGITGSAGKSTTTAMIGHILQRFYQPIASKDAAVSPPPRPKVWVGGNLGGSLLDQLPNIRYQDWVVLELSSFMLEEMGQAAQTGQFAGWSPHVAIVTNIAPNHLDRHGTLAAYAAAKQQILAHQASDDIAILGSDLPSQIQPRHHRVIYAPSLDQLQGTISLKIPGKHNQLNAWMAVEACLAAGISPRHSTAALGDFPGLIHRMQFVAQAQGVSYFNDSKATTPEATQLALESFPSGIVHVILGGYDKGSDLTALAQFAVNHCRGIYTIGTTGPLIAQAAQSALAGSSSSSAVCVHDCGTLDAAVEKIMPQLRAGDTVLLSPACASWDQYENFEARGNAFVQAVLRCTGEGAATVAST